MIRLLVFLLLFWSLELCAHVVYYNQSFSNRSFWVVEKGSHNIQASLFNQNRGEWQRLIEKKTFSSQVDFDKWSERTLHSFSQGEIRPWNSKTLHKGFLKPLWKVTEEWSTEWEKKYAHWIQDTVDKQFFYRHGVETDCADVAIGLRWIFSRINGLPAGNHLVGSGELFTQDDTLWAWRRLDNAALWYKDERFIRALNFVMNNTTSWSLAKDSYPVKLSREALIPGRYLITNKNGSWHTRVIYQSDYENEMTIPLFTIASTSPRDLRVLIKEVYLDEEWPRKGESEILAHRWPIRGKRKWFLQAFESHIDYSEEQFSEETLAYDPLFYKALFKKIKPNHTITGLIHSSIHELKSYIQQRIDIVRNGSKFCATHSCVNGTPNWEDWSTPHRDSKLLNKFKKYEEIFSDYQWEQGEVHRNWLKELKHTYVVIDGLNISISDIFLMLENNLLSSDPTQTFAARWGMDYETKMKDYYIGMSKLLKEREARIESGKCDNNCRTDSGRWWDLHTYHLDRKISELYNLFVNYCSYYEQDDRCLLAKRTIGQKIVDIKFSSKTLLEWEKLIPFFNSDPRGTIDQRWGVYPDYYTTIIPQHQTISISENGMAILDGNRLYNLKKQKWIITPENSLNLFLIGKKLYSITEQEDQLHFFLFQNKEWVEAFVLKGNAGQFDIVVSTDTEMIFTVGERLYFLNSTRPLLLKDSFKLHSVVKNKFSKLLIVWSSDSGVLLDEKGNKTFLDIKYRDKLEAFSRINDTLYVQYSDKDRDVYFAATLDLHSGQLATLLENEENHKLEFFDNRTRSAVISFNFSDEFPKLRIYNIASGKFTQVGTLLTDILFGDEGSELLIATKGRWDNDLLNTQKLIQLKVGDFAPENLALNVQSASLSYIFRHSDESYNHVEYRHSSTNFELPRMIMANTSYFAYEKISQNVPYFSWRFDAGHGDLEGVGGVCLNEVILDSEGEVIPTFTMNNFYLKQQKVRMQRLKQRIDKSLIFSGVYMSYGTSIKVWISPR